jgi:hypothetical protein
MDWVEGKNALVGMATMLAAYLDALILNGFTRVEAIQVVIAYQKEIVSQMRPTSEDNE